MARITERGRKLADKLNPYIGTTLEILETASLIQRHARTHDGIQQVWCNHELSDAATARLERREEALEERITKLADSLPRPDDGPWSVRFDGDPRTYTVRIIAPDGREIGAYVDW